MNTSYERPFIVSRKNFTGANGIAAVATSFLKVRDVPNEWHASWNALLNFFSFNKNQKAEAFQSLVNIICYRQGPENRREKEQAILLLLDSYLPKKDIQTYLSPLFTVLVNHLAIKDVIALPPVPIFSGTQSSKILTTEWMDKLPQDVRFWHAAPEIKRVNLVSNSLKQTYVKALKDWYENNSDHKQVSSSAALMKHYFAFMSEDSFKLDRFIKMIRIIYVLSGTYRSVYPALHIYSKVNGQSLKAAYSSKLAEEEFQLSDLHRNYQSEIIEARSQAGLGDPYDFSRPAKALGLNSPTLKTAGEKGKNGSKARQLPTTVSTEYGSAYYRTGLSAPEGYTVYELTTKTSIRIGDYSISQKALTTFNPKHLYERHPESWWLAHQRDWFESKHTEKSTEKTMAGALRYFNAYIFSYLPWFQENVDDSFEIPKNIEEFDPNIFVRRTHSFLLRHNPDTRLPITFVEFLRKTVDLGAQGGSASPNTIKAKENLLKDFFDSICEIESIEFNPLGQMAKTRGFSYAEAQKTKLDYNYWMLFQQFLLEFAWCANQAYRDFLDSDNGGKDSWVRAFHKYAHGRVLQNGEIEIDFGSIGGMEDHNHHTIHVFSALLCLLSQCGLRFSNVFWLDARTFDANVPEESSESTRHPVHVNTDKAKLKPFSTHVKFNVIRLLRLLNELRSRSYSDEEVPYQGNPESKWGYIVPLFRSHKSRHNESDEQKIGDAITVLTSQFENLLRGAGVKFKGYIYPKLKDFTYDDYMVMKATRDTPPIRHYLLEREAYYDESDQTPRPVTLFQYRSAITTHGLRKTFDSFWINIISPEDVRDIFTGQSVRTVGYYASNSVEEYTQALKIAEASGLPHQLRKKDKDEEALVKSIKEQGLPSDIFAISTANGDDFDLDEEYKRAPDENISVNRTHICPYANVCPKKIRAMLDNQKLCGLCPASLSFPSDAPAIAAEIRKLGDEAADLSNSINSGDLTDGEADDFRNKRMSLITQLSAWVCRHDQLIKMTDGEILLGEDGHQHYEKLVYQRPDATWTEERRNLWRIFETADVKTLQSERLRTRARRYSRRLIRAITPEVLDQIDSDPVKVSALLVQKHAQLEGLSMDEVVESLAKPGNDKSIKLLSEIIGGEDDA